MAAGKAQEQNNILYALIIGRKQEESQGRMTQGEKISILSSRIEANIHLTPEQMELVINALLEGYQKIAVIESEFRRAAEPYVYFPVELVKEGFAFWNCGGYQWEKKMGHALMAAGHNVTELKVLRTMREPNGRHTQVLLYQGCFICEFTIYGNGEEDYRIYQVISLVGHPDGCRAKCQRLITSTPSSHDSVMTDEEERRFSGLIGASMSVATKENSISTAYKVSV